MSEMSAEKKKEIEKYIIESYFGGGKNVESFVSGVDVVKGTDDGCVPDLVVAVTYFGGPGLVMINWDIYGERQGTEWKNSFALCVCKEREIEHNRCDSVDAMRYAWSEWRARIQGEPVFSETSEKDKRIEELEREVKTLKTKNEELEKAMHEFDPMPEFKELLKNLYSTEDVEKLEWALNHVCGGLGSANGWIAVSLFWKQNCEALSKLVGFSSVEEIEKYLTNEAECDTLHEAILKLTDENKYVCEQWCEANRSNNSWKAAAECNSPKELIEKLNLLRDDISGRSTVIESYKRDIEKWQKSTGCLRPEDISIAALSSKSMLLEKEVKILDGALKEWKEGTGCPSPSAAKTLINGLENAVRITNRNMVTELEREITSWQIATGCDTPIKAESKIKELETQIKEWKNATERCTPFFAGLKISVLRDSCTRYRNLLYGESRPENMVCIGGDKKTIRQYLRGRDFASAVNAINELESEIDEWRKATGCLNPRYAKIKIDAYDNYIGSNLKKKD